MWRHDFESRFFTIDSQNCRSARSYSMDYPWCIWSWRQKTRRISENGPNSRKLQSLAHGKFLAFLGRPWGFLSNGWVGSEGYNPTGFFNSRPRASRFNEKAKQVERY